MRTLLPDGRAARFATTHRSSGRLRFGSAAHIPGSGRLVSAKRPKTNPDVHCACIQCLTCGRFCKYGTTRQAIGGLFSFSKLRRSATCQNWAYGPCLCSQQFGKRRKPDLYFNCRRMAGPSGLCAFLELIDQAQCRRRQRQKRHIQFDACQCGC